MRTNCSSYEIDLFASSYLNSSKSTENYLPTVVFKSTPLLRHRVTCARYSATTITTVQCTKSCGGIITEVTSHATFLTITTQKLPKPHVGSLALVENRSFTTVCRVATVICTLLRTVLLGP